MEYCSILSIYPMHIIIFVIIDLNVSPSYCSNISSLMCLLARGRDRPVTHMTSQLANHNHQINSQWSKSCLPLLFSCSRSHFIRIYVTTGSHLRYDPFHIHYKDISNQVNLQVLSCLLSCCLSILSYLFIHINIRY